MAGEDGRFASFRLRSSAASTSGTASRRSPGRRPDRGTRAFDHRLHVQRRLPRACVAVMQRRARLGGHVPVGKPHEYWRGSFPFECPVLCAHRRSNPAVNPPAGDTTIVRWAREAARSRHPCSGSGFRRNRICPAARSGVRATGPTGQLVGSADRLDTCAARLPGVNLATRPVAPAVPQVRSASAALMRSPPPPPSTPAPAAKSRAIAPVPEVSARGTSVAVPQPRPCATSPATLPSPACPTTPSAFPASYLNRPQFHLPLMRIPPWVRFSIRLQAMVAEGDLDAGGTLTS